MTALAPPESMARLPRGRQGLPVPYVAAWSSERWAAIRHDPLVGRVAVFTGGRHGRGRPVFGAMNEARQRRAVIERRCGVCEALYEGAGWLPAHPALIAGTAPLAGREAGVTTEPPVCEPCARWSAAGCPGIASRCTGLLRLGVTVPVLQLVDPSRGPMEHDARFDGHDDPAERERLGRIARRHGGAVAYVKVAVLDADEVPL